MHNKNRSWLMNLLHQRLFFSLVVLLTSCVFAPATCQAQLLSPGIYNGKSLEEWTLDWGEWSIRTNDAGQTLPDTVDGVRYGPAAPAGAIESVFDLTLPQGTALAFSPFVIYGERYEDGSEDPVSAIADFMLFETATIEVTLNGNVVLEGLASGFPERKSGVRVFSEPVFYLEPQDRGGINAVASIFEQGVGVMFDLPVGEHTITNVLASEFFGGPFTTTYNITVVPEPATVLSLVFGTFVAIGRRRPHQLKKSPNEANPRGWKLSR
jgi:hypothetical protein